MGIHMLELPKKNYFWENRISNMWSVKTSVRLQKPAGLWEGGQGEAPGMGLIAKESRYRSEKLYSVTVNWKVAYS